MELFSKVTFQLKNNCLLLKVINGGCATSQEADRIRNIVTQARRIRNTMEAFEKVGDTQEGASLGTITTILMLRKMGLPDDSYHFESDTAADETSVSLMLPLNLITDIQTKTISSDIAREIRVLPGFPVKISQIQDMLTGEDVDSGKIAGAILSDPGLTSDILKQVNANVTSTSERTGDVKKSLELIGMKGLRDLITTYGSEDSFTDDTGIFNRLWEDANRVATLSYLIALELGLNPLRDDAFVGGLLHDIGKILIYRLHPGLLNMIRNHCGSDENDQALLENLALGSSHAKIGAEIASFWNFPDFLVSVIRHHHSPLLAPDEFQVLTAIVHLAVCMNSPGKESVNYDSIQPEVLALVGIRSKGAWKDLVDRMDSFFRDIESR